MKFSENTMKDSLKNILSVMIMIGIVLSLVSCGGSGQIRYHSALEPGVSIKRVAVLPLVNLTSVEEADERIRRMVIAELLSRGVDVIEPGEVSRVLREKNVRSVRALSIEDIQKIGEELGVEAVVTGAVIAYNMSGGINVTYPEVTIDLQLIDTKTGKILWSVWNTAGGPDFWVRHFGAEGKSLSETARDVVKQSLDTIF